MDIPEKTPGLENPDNSCYMNASLQCLLHCPPLTPFFCKNIDHRRCGTYPFCSRCEVGALAEKMFRPASSDLCFAADQILQNIEAISPEFNEYDQQDALEFLSALTDHIAGKELEQSGISIAKDVPSTTLMQAPIYKILGGALGSETTCSWCGTTCEAAEFMPSLSVPTNDARTIEEALQKYVDFGKVEGLLHCEKCQMKTPAVKRYFIRRAPNVFLLNLLPRYRVFPNGRMEKDEPDAYARISEILDLAPYMVHPKNDCCSVLYTLTGVIVHKGRSTRAGHYVAFVKGKNGIWFRKDDEMSVQVPLSTVLKQNAYILFYEKNTEQLDDFEYLLNLSGSPVLETRQQESIAEESLQNPGVLPIAEPVQERKIPKYALRADALPFCSASPQSHQMISKEPVQSPKALPTPEPSHECIVPKFIPNADAMSFCPASLSSPMTVNATSREDGEVRRDVRSSKNCNTGRSDADATGSLITPGDRTPFHRSLVKPSQVYRRAEDVEAERKLQIGPAGKPSPSPKQTKKPSKKKKYSYEGASRFHRSFYNPSTLYRRI